MTLSSKRGWPCVCGGRAYSGEEMVAMSDAARAGDWLNYWRSILGPDDFYCADDDEVLTREEAWRVRGLMVPVHDLSEDEARWSGELEELIW